MEIKRIPKTHWCCICDNKMAEVEICHNGSLKLFWACSPEDNEITLCPRCFAELKRQINSINL